MPTPFELLLDPVSLAVLAIYGVTMLCEALAPARRLPNVRFWRTRHSRHHARGVHAGNYAELPLFDMLFDTFVNPPRFAKAAGFYHGASARVADMLRFRDVSGEPT